MIVNNLLDGSIRAREGATYTATNNVVGSALYLDAAGGDLRPGNGEAVRGRGRSLPEGGLDPCGQAYASAAPDIGPLHYDAPAAAGGASGRERGDRWGYVAAGGG